MENLARIERAFVARLEELLRETLAFRNQIDWNSSPSDAVRRAIGYFESELNDPHGLTTALAALESFTDSLAHMMLSALQNN